MFGSFFIRLLFGLLLFLIASKKGYKKLLWATLGVLLGPIALVAIFIYRKNADYSKALFNGVTGTLLGVVLAIGVWYFYGYLNPERFDQISEKNVYGFWYVVLPAISVFLGLIFFTVSMIRSANNQKMLRQNRGGK